MWSTIRFRMGGTYQVGDVPIHAWPDHAIYHTQVRGLGITLIGALLINYRPLLGGLHGLGASVWAVVWSWKKRKERPEVFLTIGSFLGIPLVWLALFPNHVIIHDYQALIAAPLVAIGLGFALKLGIDRLKGPFRWSAAIAIPALLIVPLARQTREDFRRLPQGEVLDYAEDLEDSTSSSSIILSPSDSMIPVYYSRRHIIRSVTDDAALRHIMSQARFVFPNRDIYLAIPPKELGKFSCASSQLPLIKRTPNMILFKATTDDCG